jgi:hypothetical protein
MTRPASEILDSMIPPENGEVASYYRAYTQEFLARLDWDELFLLCRFFQTDVSQVTSKVASYQMDRAAQLARLAPRKGGTPCATK